MSTSSFFNTAPLGSSETTVTGESVAPPSGEVSPATAKSSFYSGTGPSSSETHAIESAVAQTTISAQQAAEAAASAAATFDSLSIDDVSGLSEALVNKVDDPQVLTNVPSGAVFTDTTYENVSAFTNDSNYLTPTSSIDAGNF